MQPMQKEEYELPDSSNDVALFDQYGKDIFAYARMHTSSREDAEDITLEVFTAALENDNLSALREGERLAWLRRVAHNKLVDRYRRATKYPIVTLDQIAETIIDDKDETPEQHALLREAHGELHTAIKALPHLQQQLLKLRYGDGLRFAQIAILLNKREETVRKLLSRTLALLRSTYKQQENGERR